MCEVAGRSTEPPSGGDAQNDLTIDMSGTRADQKGCWDTRLWKPLLCQGDGGAKEDRDLRKAWGGRCSGEHFPSQAATIIYQAAQEYISTFITQAAPVCAS